jgi:hypothetical protein
VPGQRSVVVADQVDDGHARALGEVGVCPDFR